MYISYKEKNINEKERKTNNEKYINKQLKEEKEYVKDQEAVWNTVINLIDEIYQMVIAGAGTGKTTTICAKVNYLIEKRK